MATAFGRFLPDRRLTAVVFGAAFGAAACFGQPAMPNLPPSDPPAIEVWHGNRRSDPGKPEARPTPPVAAEPVALPPAPPPVPAAPATSVADDLGKAFQTIGTLAAHVRSAVESSRPAAPSGSIQLAAVQATPRTLAEVAPPAPAPSAPRDVPASVTPAAPPETNWVQVAVVAGAVLMCPVPVALIAALVLRRTGIRLHVEFSGAGPTGFAAAPPEPKWGPANPLTQHEPEVTAGRFDLGPTYEEEQAARAREAANQEQAVLQQIFEDNLRLHEQIGEIKADEVGEPA
ncbi:MAG: hypothetical protein ACRC33_23355 [Gemmataceae bacterium]